MPCWNNRLQSKINCLEYYAKADPQSFLSALNHSGVKLILYSKIIQTITFWYKQFLKICFLNQNHD